MNPDTPAIVDLAGANSTVLQRLMRHGFDVDAMRPWVGADGRSYITTNKNGKAEAIVTNAVQGTLTKEQWQLVDDVVIKVAKARLKLVGDLRSSGLEYALPNAMATTVIQHQLQSDMTPATISMDGARKSEGDRPVYDLVNVPVPIIHKDFSIPGRQLAISQSGGGVALDLASISLCTERCAEAAEQLLVGSTTYQYGGGNIYGYTNFPFRQTFVLTNPTSAGWSPLTTLNELLQMKTLSQTAFHYGPWRVYFSLAWEPYLDNDYKALGNMTLRQRLRMIEGFQGVETADYLSTTGAFKTSLVQQSRQVVEEVVGMEFTTLQWSSPDGMEQFFKILGIMFPRLRADHNGNTGIVDGTAP